MCVVSEYRDLDDVVSGEFVFECMAHMAVGRFIHLGVSLVCLWCHLVRELLSY